MDLSKYTWHHVGSSYTCEGVAGFTPKDVDWLAFVPEEDFEEAKAEHLSLGWKVDDGYDVDDGWLSFKKKVMLGPDINRIISKDFLWVQRFLQANELCKKLKLVDKEKRIILHEHFLKQ